ncbi:Rv1733c family protein [Streptomyces sirii]|uniref:Rv1733c family protein n=1 Tax=Streptomyces sirii TaxID=3127701 RepID=UPI003D3614CD
MSARGSPDASSPHPPRHGHPPEAANPLRRTSDRVESGVFRLLMLLLVFGLPVASTCAGLAACDSSMRAVQAQSTERYEVTARLASNVEGVQRRTENAEHRAQVRWTDRNGKERTGIALVKGGTPEGATVRIWLKRDGSISSPPMTVRDATATGWLVGGMTAVGVASALFGARAGMRLVLDRRRHAQWDAEWASVEPRWSARFRQ